MATLAGMADIAGPAAPLATLTFCARLAVLVMKLPLPLYVAVIVSDPVGSFVVLYEAVPPVSATLASVVAPSMNVTEPVGVPLPGAFAATVAVKVTDCPKTDGFADEATEVVVGSWVTTSFSVPVAGLKLVSPP